MAKTKIERAISRVRKLEKIASNARLECVGGGIGCRCANCITLALAKNRGERAGSVHGRALGMHALESADNAARKALNSGASDETVARIAVNLELSIKARNGKANTTGAAAKVDRLFKADLIKSLADMGQDLPDNASRIMSPNVRGKARPYGFRISAPNSRRGGVHANARRKANALHETHDKRVRVAKLVSRLDVLEARLTTPNLSSRFKVRAENEVKHLNTLLAALGV